MKKLNSSRAFSPGILSTLITLLLIPCFVYLGVWQWNRYQQKIFQQQELESKLNEPALILSSLPLTHKEKIHLGDPTLRYRQLKISGSFLNEKALLLDNQIFNGKVGYYVITPFQPENSQHLLLVNRGWVPIGTDRSRLPTILAVIGKKSLIGTIIFPAGGLQLKEIPFPENAWPLRIQRIDFTKLSKHYGKEIYPFLLHLNSNDPLGFSLPPIAITSNFPPQKHLAYAIQWFVLALGVLIYYLFINIKRTH